VSASTVPLPESAAARPSAIGQHEEVDQEQVEREHPDRAAQVLLVDVFHHRDLELARQQERSNSMEAACPSCRRRPVSGRRRRQSGAQLGHRGGAREEVAEAVVQSPRRDEDADGEEGDQLDHRLEGDRRHHALVALGGIEVAGAEQDGEGGEDHRDVERAVLPQRHRPGSRRHHDLRVLAQDGEAVGDRLQLQRDVGHHADHRDHRDQAAEQLALAVARGDEVGDRGDAVGLGDPDHRYRMKPASANSRVGPR
jgi:hypothetical protein